MVKKKKKKKTRTVLPQLKVPYPPEHGRPHPLGPLHQRPRAPARDVTRQVLLAAHQGGPDAPGPEQDCPAAAEAAEQRHVCRGGRLLVDQLFRLAVFFVTFFVYFERGIIEGENVGSRERREGDVERPGTTERESELREPSQRKKKNEKNRTRRARRRSPRAPPRHAPPATPRSRPEAGPRRASGRGGRRPGRRGRRGGEGEKREEVEASSICPLALIWFFRPNRRTFRSKKK